ncbi:ATP-binding protein [Sandaracinus amylolyticus]|uniref:histidine kinase n=1 Tax=Sandaracinus amylolyticus TaxID=927083 RepID=A0A0F6W832_9BACT|nr:ATP-binding protein [Sandaracinus amylolyticus]AKF09868.1 diguanylate cyclase/phosphodiesterase (GGDEF & EAL domains) with PAS/PAC sensor(s) [Sandaracinus amylolyticus]
MTSDPHELLTRIEEHARAALDGRTEASAALEAIARLASQSTPVAKRDHDRESSSVLKNIIDHIPYVVFWKDVRSVYLGCNAALARIGGLASPDDIVGRDDFSMPWTREEAEFFRSVDRRVMESGEAELDIEETQVQADGRQRVILTSKVPLRDESNRIIGILGIFTDITEQKELEQQLRQAKDAAEVSARAKSDFLAVVSHELRTPLTLILSPLESLLSEARGELPARVVDTLESVHRNAQRLRILTEDILEFSRREAGHLALDPRPLDVAAHVGQLVLDLAPAAAARGLELRATTLDPALGVALVDIAKLDKILINLLGNALKFTPAGGEITVSAALVDETIVLAVRDTGIGIDPADHERVFRRFEQIEGGSARAHGGVGLGLSLVKGLVDSMDGSISVESELGRGATFTVRIPRRAADRGARSPVRDLDLTPRALIVDAPADSPASPTSARAPADAARVVVAEDSSDLRQYLTQLLSAEFQVVAVANGQLAYEVIRELKPDVVVSDVMMPVMDGFELVRRLKADPALATIPVVLLTARAGAEAAADGLDRGADDYLSKPFSPLDLLARVRSAHRMKVLRDRLLEAHRRAADAEREETLRDTRAALAELGKVASLGEMAAAIAHELNQPLAGVGLSARALMRWLRAERPDMDEVQAAADRIVRDVKRAADVVTRIRELFGNSSGAKVPVDVNDAVTEVIALTRDRMRDAGASIRAELAPDLPPALGDRVQLQQVIVNLVINAADAMRDVSDRPREVRLRTQLEAGRVRVDVSDVGVGVSDDDKDRIFNAFHTTKAGGMGIGLSICKTIVESHGGRLVVSSHDGPGSTFHFALPLFQPE